MSVPVKEGDRIDDVYRVERVIGTGGMAVVVAAIDERVPERVAIKVLFKKAAKVSEILVRFEREQRVIQQLRNEHVARVLGGGVFRNAPYMVMEYLQGSDLSEVLRVQGPLPIEHAAEYLLQACEAVAEAHGHDVIHRDLKPGNLFLTHRPDGSPCIKVLDFGIAKIADPQLGGSESTLTQTTAVMGSPYYMSPEQMISAKEVSKATDIWALGVILYELLAGKLPFAAKSADAVWARVLNDEPDPLLAARPDCPKGLEAVVLRCLQRTPSKRFANVGELARAIAPFAPPAAREAVPRIFALLSSHGPIRPPQTSYPEIVIARDPTEPPEAPTVYMAPRKSRLGRNALMIAFGVGMLAVGFAGGSLMRGNSSPAGRSPMASAAVTPSFAAARTAPSAHEPGLDDDMPTSVPIELDLDEEVARIAKQKADRARRTPLAPPPTQPAPEKAEAQPTSSGAAPSATAPATAVPKPKPSATATSSAPAAASTAPPASEPPVPAASTPAAPASAPAIEKAEPPPAPASTSVAAPQSS